MAVKPGGRTDPASRIEKVIADSEPVFANAFFLAIDTITDQFTLTELAELLERGDVEGALTALDDAGRLLGGAYGEALVLAGQSAATFLSGALTTAVAFDVINFRAVEAIQRNSLRLVSQFTAEQRNATRLALAQGIERGLNPKDQARLFRNSIGLTTRQVQAVDNFRRMLENRDPEVLTRKLRDKRFDRTIQRAIRDEQPLTKVQIDKMVDRYRERYVNHRAVVIARTEALRSAHEGSEVMYRQAIDQGLLQEEQLERTWRTARDERVRASHNRLNGITRMLGETYPADDGPLRFPGDPEGPANETIQCRCILITRLNDI